jgi:hypothetical protein
MKEIKIKVPDYLAKIFAKKLVALANECLVENSMVKKVEIDLYDTSIPIWDRIKTVEDSIAYTGMTLPDNIAELPLDVQAMMKLRIVCAAYNELKKDELDQFPLFTDGEYRYYPWFWLYTQEEIDKMDEEERSRVLGRSGYSAYALAGGACSSTYYASSHSCAFYGGRLCFKTRELAMECGKRFAKLWGQFFAFLKEED